MPIRQYYEDKRKSPAYVFFDNISPAMLTSVVAFEDPKFYRHPGVDPIAVIIAAKRNIQKRAIYHGASTITMQLARNIYLSFEITWKRKLTELFIAFYIEKYLDKQEILELYLNMIDYGNNCFGIKQAADFYFHKAALELDYDEAIALCAVLQAPIDYNPLLNPETHKLAVAIKREKLVKKGILKA